MAPLCLGGEAVKRPFELVMARAHRPLAKVCGLSRQADLYHAMESGADFAGFVSHKPSPRHMADAQIIALCGVVHDAGARAALVIVDAERSATDRLAHAAGVDVVQLCGGETPGQWKHTSYGLLRRVGVDASNPDACFEEVHAWRGVADAFVLDHPSTAGGSGQTVDLALAEDLARLVPCFLAGGLDGDADVFASQPSMSSPAPFVGFDASSRLEARPGAKDPKTVTRFIQAAHRYPQAPSPGIST